MSEAAQEQEGRQRYERYRSTGTFLPDVRYTPLPTGGYFGFLPDGRLHTISPSELAKADQRYDTTGGQQPQQPQSQQSQFGLMPAQQQQQQPRQPAVSPLGYAVPQGWRYNQYGHLTPGGML